MKETLWTKLAELWAIRRRCNQIKLQQNRQPEWLKPPLFEGIPDLPPYLNLQNAKPQRWA